MRRLGACLWYRRSIFRASWSWVWIEVSSAKKKFSNAGNVHTHSDEQGLLYGVVNWQKGPSYSKPACGPCHWTQLEGAPVCH